MRSAASRSDRKGQALVEFALLMPIFLILVMGIVEFGRAWNAHQVLTDAAREAARTAVVDDPTVTQDSVVLVVRHALHRAALNADAADVQVVGFRTGRGTPATINVSYPYQIRWLAALLDWSGTDAEPVLKTSFSMRNE